MTGEGLPLHKPVENAEILVGIVGRIAMCSGCSGYFDGEEDGPEGANTGSEGPAWGWFDQGLGCERAVTEVDDYEVLVSDARIVERRLIRASSSDFDAGEGGHSGTQVGHRGLKPEQPTKGSARTYRTQELDGALISNRITISPNQLIWLLLAASAIGGMIAFGATR